MKKQTPDTTPSPDELADRAMAALDRHVLELEARKEPLKAKDRVFWENGTEPVELTASKIHDADRLKQFQNGFAPEIAGLTAGEECWMVRNDLRLIDAAIASCRNEQRRQSIRIVARTMAAHQMRMKPILQRTCAAIRALQAVNRERAAACETTLQEGQGWVDHRSITWSGFELLGLGNGTGMSAASGEVYDFFAECERQGIRKE